MQLRRWVCGCGSVFELLRPHTHCALPTHNMRGLLWAGLLLFLLAPCSDRICGWPGRPSCRVAGREGKRQATAHGATTSLGLPWLPVC